MALAPTKCKTLFLSRRFLMLSSCWRHLRFTTESEEVQPNDSPLEREATGNSLKEGEEGDLYEHYSRITKKRKLRKDKKVSDFHRLWRMFYLKR